MDKKSDKQVLSQLVKAVQSGDVVLQEKVLQEAQAHLYTRKPTVPVDVVKRYTSALMAYNNETRASRHGPNTTVPHGSMIAMEVKQASLALNDAINEAIAESYE